jgi:hypothetical protein
MNRREFLGTGIVLAGSAAAGELLPGHGSSFVSNAVEAGGASSVQQQTGARGAMWLSTLGDPGTMLDAPLRRFLFARMPTVAVLNGELTGYQQLVADTHAQFPDLRVLRYSNAQRVPEGTRVACTMFPHVYKYAKDLALIRTDGSPKIVGPLGDRVVWTDITLAATREFIVSHIAKQVATHGTDGVAIDSYHTRLVTTNLENAWVKAEQWPLACVALLRELRAAMPRKLIWFNGIWASDEAMIAAQARLLAYADGASVEFYGYDDMGNITTDTFQRIVTPINAMLEAHPDEPILVRGTARHATFYEYRVDLQNARYCYGCYLLARTPGSFFNYGQNFQIARIPRERAGGGALYSYFELPLGSPTAPAAANGTGGWSRLYQGGQVFVTPAEGGPQAFRVGFDAWSPTGMPYRWGSTVVVQPGDALLLLRERPAPPPFELEAHIEDSTTDWLVQCETGEFQYRYLTITVTSADPHSAVLVRFETDDDPRPFGILTILPESGDFDPGTRDYPYRYDTRLAAAHVRSRIRYGTDDGSVPTELTIPLQDACAPYPCFRVVSVKAIGAVRVHSIRLTDPEVIPA